MSRRRYLPENSMPNICIPREIVEGVGPLMKQKDINIVLKGAHLILHASQPVLEDQEGEGKESHQKSVTCISKHDRKEEWECDDGVGSWWRGRDGVKKLIQINSPTHPCCLYKMAHKNVMSCVPHPRDVLQSH